MHLAAILARLPDDDEALVPYLYNASFSLERPQGLMVLRKVLELPEPPKESSEARSAYVMAWNNACIHAHALGDYPLAVELADGGQLAAPRPVRSAGSSADTAIDRVFGSARAASGAWDTIA